MYALRPQGAGFAVFPMAFTHMVVAKIKWFDFPGRKFRFHTAMIYNPNSSLRGLNEIAERVEEEFDLHIFS